MNDIKSRLKLIRKSFNLTQTEFGEKLGVSLSFVRNRELGAVQIEEHIINLICKTFDVSYHWLKNGEGDMNDRSDIDLIEEIDALTIGTNEKTRTALRIAASFTDEDWVMLDKIVEKIIKGIDKNTLLSYVEEKYKK